MNVAHMVAWAARRHGDRVALISGDDERTFADVGARTRRLAASLAELGVKKGDRVGILVANQPEYLEAEFAVATAGAVRVPMLTTLTVAEIARYIGHSGAKLVIASKACAPALREALATCEDPVGVVVIGGGEEQGESAYEHLIGGAGAAWTAPDLTEDDTYAIRFTGGTTGTPKAVTMSHRSMVHVVQNMLLNWPLDDTDVALSIHPLSHAAGMMSYPYWVAGAANVIRPAFGFDPHDFLHTVERHGVTSVFVIPTVLNVLLESDALGRYDHSTLRSVVYGGAPIPLTRLRQALDVFGPVFIQVYGTSEAPMLLTTLARDEHLVGPGEPPPRLRSAGREALGVEVKVVDPDGNPCPAGAVGEVAARGPNNMTGYWGNAELSASRMRDGWVHTGDMGRFDEDGYLYIVDRKEDMIITGGFNVWPAEIEDSIYQHPGVREAAVFGVEHSKWGEAVAAVVVPRGSAQLDPDEVVAFLRERLASYKVPKCVVIRAEPIPGSAVGKMLRRKVREEHAGEITAQLR